VPVVDIGTYVRRIAVCRSSPSYPAVSSATAENETKASTHPPHCAQCGEVSVVVAGRYSMVVLVTVHAGTVGVGVMEGGKLRGSEGGPVLVGRYSVHVVVVV